MSASAGSFVVVLIVMAMRASVMASKFALAIFIAHYLDLIIPWLVCARLRRHRNCARGCQYRNEPSVDARRGHSLHS